VCHARWWIEKIAFIGWQDLRAEGGNSLMIEDAANNEQHAFATPSTGGGERSIVLSLLQNIFPTLRMGKHFM
jgi:hypothetical protein